MHGGEVGDLQLVERSQQPGERRDDQHERGRVAVAERVDRGLAVAALVEALLRVEQILRGGGGVAGGESVALRQHDDRLRRLRDLHLEAACAGDRERADVAGSSPAPTIAWMRVSRRCAAAASVICSSAPPPMSSGDSPRTNRPRPPSGSSRSLSRSRPTLCCTCAAAWSWMPAPSSALSDQRPERRRGEREPRVARELADVDGRVGVAVERLRHLRVAGRLDRDLVGGRGEAGGRRARPRRISRALCARRAARRARLAGGVGRASSGRRRRTPARRPGRRRPRRVKREASARLDPFDASIAALKAGEACRRRRSRRRSPTYVLVVCRRRRRRRRGSCRRSRSPASRRRASASSNASRSAIATATPSPAIGSIAASGSSEDRRRGLPEPRLDVARRSACRRGPSRQSSSSSLVQLGAGIVDAQDLSRGREHAVLHVAARAHDRLAVDARRRRGRRWRGRARCCSRTSRRSLPQPAASEGDQQRDQRKQAGAVGEGGEHRPRILRTVRRLWADPAGRLDISAAASSRMPRNAESMARSRGPGDPEVWG